MAFLIDKQELKPGLIIFRRADVKHRKWYCRIKIPNASRYKTLSLDTTDLNEARDKAFDHDAELRFKVKHRMPVFEKSFSQVAKEYSDFQKGRSEAGEITHKRWAIEDSYIRVQLNRYVGNMQISMLGEDKWKGYPVWRQKNSKGRYGDRVSDWTIRSEMATFRAIMIFAAGKEYIRENRVPKARLNLSKPRREEFTPQEYRDLHTFARKWVKQGRNLSNKWYREMTYNFMLVMANTGMRTQEARNLRWRDIDTRADRQGRSFVAINVRGKGKFRELIAASTVATYLERIKAISKATKPDDPVFTTYDGTPAVSLYNSLIEDLFKSAKLLLSASGGRRSSYSFRHTYATFRLMEGVDVYFLAKQMGTSVQMIEDYYGHITPAKNAERILAGVPGWQPVPEASGKPDDGLKADGAGSKKAAKPRKKRG